MTAWTSMTASAFRLLVIGLSAGAPAFVAGCSSGSDVPPDVDASTDAVVDAIAESASMSDAADSDPTSETSLDAAPDFGPPDLAPLSLRVLNTMTDGPFADCNVRVLLGDGTAGPTKKADAEGKVHFDAVDWSRGDVHAIAWIGAPRFSALVDIPKMDDERTIMLEGSEGPLVRVTGKILGKVSPTNRVTLGSYPPTADTKNPGRSFDGVGDEFSIDVRAGVPVKLVAYEERSSVVSPSDPFAVRYATIDLPPLTTAVVHDFDFGVATIAAERSAFVTFASAELKHDTSVGLYVEQGELGRMVPSIKLLPPYAPLPSDKIEVAWYEAPGMPVLFRYTNNSGGAAGWYTSNTVPTDATVVTEFPHVFSSAGAVVGERLTLDGIPPLGVTTLHHAVGAPDRRSFMTITTATPGATSMYVPFPPLGAPSTWSSGDYLPVSLVSCTKIVGSSCREGASAPRTYLRVP